MNLERYKSEQITLYQSRTNFQALNHFNSSRLWITFLQPQDKLYLIKSNTYVAIRYAKRVERNRVQRLGDGKHVLKQTCIKRSYDNLNSAKNIPSKSETQSRSASDDMGTHMFAMR